MTSIIKKVTAVSVALWLGGEIYASMLYIQYMREKKYLKAFLLNPIQFILDVLSLGFRSMVKK